MQPSGPDQYMTRVNLLRTSGSPIKGLGVLIENHRSQGGDKQWCESSTTTQWPHQPKVMGMEERSHMSMNCISMYVYTHNLAKKQKNKNAVPIFRWHTGHIWCLSSLQRMKCEGKWRKPNISHSACGHRWDKKRRVSVHCDDKFNVPQLATLRSRELSICEIENVPETTIYLCQALPSAEWQVSAEEAQWTVFISPGQANTRHIGVMD